MWQRVYHFQRAIVQKFGSCRGDIIISDKRYSRLPLSPRGT
jgi:hypothetical protein